MSGSLYLCPTPIGNLEDITLRVLRVLKEVDIIAAEDTRQTLKLLNHYDIKKTVVSYHEHNKVSSGEKLLIDLKAGKNVALVTDAGTPGISDPGEDLVKLCLEEKINVVSLPGATAITTALVGSGLDTKKFVFLGFLPTKKSERESVLDEIGREKRTVIIYEAPHRIVRTLEELKPYIEDRKVVIARELTKVHEEYIRGTADEVLSKLGDDVKGEIVVLIEGGKDEVAMEPEELLRRYIECGMDKKEAIKLTAKQLKIPKSEIYKLALKDES
ncbi:MULTISPECIES: 16S rRNA (cytidine(1402)-2'-O)-methyltransferase [Thermoanaerobacterium]|uniref:Ribosomal RNA small subunit methyltransferase I n=2 Tax=Thermoanaerobacterium TaxID=28895 RepID=W9EAG8_9THEO|nr:MULTISPECIES: 16S rRNA (cytidine(1402)-2'-O)-methyltransferase [Thermoanaerobacterium]AFK85671.1 Ribosomal RNA small subunit methyltransferase I [Thermoanaerobacterium saccharolyticum JW/SL-YS485]ETO37915.1 Ribosomal RNA small subunit methyltransferase I [Thermoanaerobacterium aotearoense SCUT27]